MIEGSTQKPAVQQLNAEEFENVEYHATFDPIAAAQAKRDELTEAEPARSELAEPICRTMVLADDILNLRRRCQCGLFGQMAHVALPELKHPMARSKKVFDMFQLANVASISEQECWGDERKEEELRKKNSSYLTPYGLALALDAHRRRCHEYADAIDNARGKKFDHAPVVPQGVTYDKGAYLSTAISMLGQLKRSSPNVSAKQPVLIALPQAFSRVNAKVDYDSHVRICVYADWATLASRLLDIEITTTIIVVWPDKMPESREMRQVLIGLERHLQCGGTLLFYPSPFEDNNEDEWRRRGEVCREFVQYMTRPERAFEGVVRDHYSDILESVPYTHPAMCLGTEPRYKRSPYLDRQILLFLEKVRLSANDLIKLPEFYNVSPEEKERRRQQKIIKAKRRYEERKPNFWVIEDPHRQRHKKSISFKEPKQLRKTAHYHDSDHDSSHDIRNTDRQWKKSSRPWHRKPEEDRLK